jgi:hypothetical protein
MTFIGANDYNRRIVAEMRDMENKQQHLFGQPTMMPYRERPTLTGGALYRQFVLSGNDAMSNYGGLDGLVTSSPALSRGDPLLQGGMMKKEDSSDDEEIIAIFDNSVRISDTPSPVRPIPKRPGNITGNKRKRGEGMKIPKGSHMMPDGTVMKDSEHTGGMMKGIKKTIELIPPKIRKTLSKKVIEVVNQMDAKDVALLSGGSFSFSRDILGNVKKAVNLIPLKVRRGLTKKAVELINSLSADDVKALMGAGLNMNAVRKLSKEEEMSGGSFWSDISKTASKAFKSVKKGVSKALPVIKKDVEKVIKLIPPKIRKAIKDKTVQLAPDVLSGALSAVAVATGQPELVPVAGIVGNIAGKAVGKAIKGSGMKKPNKRAEIVKKIMRERGLKMIDASRAVKAEGLYKP